jgi:hypothetical protein
MTLYWMLKDGIPVPVEDVREWERWWEVSKADCIVAKTTIGEVEVSTVFLGRDHSFMAGSPPILFETMVFGGERDQAVVRYSTLEEAMHGHERIVGLIRGDHPDTAS